MASERAKWKLLVTEESEEEQAVALLETCRKLRGQARGLHFEYWICRIGMQLGTPLRLKDPDKALYKKKQEFDSHKHDYCTYVWKPLRERAKPLLDRGLATALTKAKKADKANGKKQKTAGATDSD